MPAQDVDAAAHYTPLGSIESSAPVSVLLTTLQTLCPQWNIRLVPIDADGLAHYRVEIDNAAQPPDGTIDAWLHIKSALMARFPAGKPNAVTAIDP